MSTAMVLSESNVQWLRGLPGDVNHGDLAKAYSFEHPLNHSQRLEKQLLSMTPGDENLLWWVQLWNEKQEDVLDPPLARRIFKEVALAASAKECGPVARNELFMIRDPFKKRGLAKLLYRHELSLYKKWGIKEIHLSARGEGCVVWPKKFGFLPRRPGYVRAQYLDWARRRKAEVVQAPVDMADYPNEFLLSRDGLELFKVIS